MARFSVSDFTSSVKNFLGLNRQYNFEIGVMCDFVNNNSVEIKSVVRKGNGHVVLLDNWGQEILPNEITASDLQMVFCALENYSMDRPESVQIYK